MKKTLSALLIIATLIGLCSCGRKYKPQKSTEEESRVVMTLSVDGETYNVKYELYKALFLANKSAVDGGDDGVWQGDRAQEYIDLINERIILAASNIYSAFHLADTLDINVSSSEADDFVDECIRIGVEGDGNVVGAGSYEEYLAQLKSRGMNYAVGELMLRYSYALSKINEYFIGESDVALGNMGGNLDLSDSAITEFYNSSDSVRVLRAFVPQGLRSEEWIENFRDELAAKGSDTDRALYIINNTSVAFSELILNGEITGIVQGRSSLDRTYYSDYIDEAFSLEAGEVSRVITVEGTGDITSDGYYVLVALEKTEEHLSENIDLIKDEYIANEIGKRLGAICDSLIDSASLSADYSNISHKDIKADP